LAAWIIAADAAGVTIAVQVVPRARRNQVEGPHGDALRVRVAAPPVEGAANEALLSFLAERLGVRARQVGIVSGAHTRHKRVHIAGLDAATVAARLGP